MVSGAKMNMIKSSSRQKTRKNKVILPKIMFYNQSGSSKQLELPSLENSDRLISMDRATIDHFPMGNNQLDFSGDDIQVQLANNEQSEQSVADLMPPSDFSGSIIFDYEFQANGAAGGRRPQAANENHQKSPFDRMHLLNYLKQPVTSTSATGLTGI